MTARTSACLTYLFLNNNLCLALLSLLRSSLLMETILPWLINMS